MAVFVDGCFWHGCPVHYSAPLRQQKFWAQKLRTNVVRDLAVDDALAELGWLSFHLWQHDLNEVDRTVQMLAEQLKDRVFARESSIGLDPQAVKFESGEAAIDSPLGTYWYRCECGSQNVRVLAVSGPGSLRPKAMQRPRSAELACVRCRRIFQQTIPDILG
jgi:hypothetical protein